MHCIQTSEDFRFKGEHIRDLEAAIQHVHSVNDEFPKIRAVVDCYVLLKPPFLTESEAIQDAIRSIDWAYDRGVDIGHSFCKHGQGKYPLLVAESATRI